MVVAEEGGQFVTQRQDPKLTTVTTELPPEAHPQYRPPEAGAGAPAPAAAPVGWVAFS